jgi:hypothetical protein
MIDEFGRTWKESAVPESLYYPDICMEGLKKISKYISRHSLCPSRYSNRACSEYMSRALLLDQRAQSRIIIVIIIIIIIIIKVVPVLN